MSRIGENLKVLSVFHYIVAGLYAVFLTMMGLFTGLMGYAVSVTPPRGAHVNPATQHMMLLITGGLGLFILVMGWIYAILTAWSGYSIARGRRRYFSLVMASVNLLAFPMGTALGIFTFILLRREDAMWWYAGGGREENGELPNHQ